MLCRQHDGSVEDAHVDSGITKVNNWEWNGSTHYQIPVYYFMFATFDRDDVITAYINGEVHGTVDCSYYANINLINNNHCTIGANASTATPPTDVGNYLSMHMGPAYFYNRVLTAAEVNQNFEALKDRFNMHVGRQYGEIYPS